MFGIVLTTLLIASPLETPAAIPERWLLQLTPKELPKLPEGVMKTTWTKSFTPRDGGGWQEWFVFAPGTGELTITRQNFRLFKIDADDAKSVTRRTVPFAVCGVLVEFDRKLFTVATTEWKGANGKVTPLLILGAAVEVRPNVWYQAFSDALEKGQSKVTELLVEFATNPRQCEDGKVTVRKHMRLLDKTEGEMTEFTGKFAKKEYGTRAGTEITGLVKHADKEPTPTRLWLQFTANEVPAKFNIAPTVQLAAATAQPPKPQSAATPGLVYPPDK